MRTKQRTRPATDTCCHCGSRLGTGALARLCPRCLLQQGVGSPANPHPRAFEAPAPARVKDLVPYVEILELLGQGGMGAVYKGREVFLDRLVAVKVIPDNESSGASIASRFEREARALARFNHPNIVAIHQYGSACGFSYFTMDYVEGPTLRQILKAKPLPPARAVEIFSQLCDGLAHAHAHGVTHRDIKPENILVDKQGRAKIADFGIAKLNEDARRGRHSTAGRDRLGTPYYMAPEQVERPKALDHRADIYAAGTVLYEMLTGELPLGRFPSPSARAATSVELDRAIFRALEKDPRDRFQTIAKFKTAVISAWAGLSEACQPNEIPATPDLELAAARLEANLTPQADANGLERLKQLYRQLHREEDTIRVSLRLIESYRREGRLASAVLEGQNLLLCLSPGSKLAVFVRHDMQNTGILLETQEELLDARPDMYRMGEFLKHSSPSSTGRKRWEASPAS